MTTVCRVHPDRNINERAEIIQLHLECFRRNELHDEMLDRGFWWMAFDESREPIGFAGMHPSVRWSDAVYLCRSGVTFAARGQGLQKRLIAARLVSARHYGFRHVITDTRRNPASANSLIACGFRMYQPAAPWSFRDACYWKKELK